MGGLIQILGHVLSALIAVMACVWLGLTTPTARVMEVDSAGLLQRFSQSQPNVSDAQLAQNVQRYLSVMEQVLSAMAVQNGVVIVDAELAIAGAEDVTDTAYTRAIALMRAGDAS